MAPPAHALMSWQLFCGPPPWVVPLNRCRCRRLMHMQCVPGGQMLLLDGGCELHGYCSDVTRTWPVGGTYSPQQRALYEAVLEAHRCACTRRVSRPSG